MNRDLINQNADKRPNDREMKALREYFPSCFTKEGEFDLDRFKHLISANISLTNESYGIDFLGRNYARMLTSLETTTAVKPDVNHNGKEENKDSRNLYISGDNIDALKHLLGSYAGKVKCIYIDPPYNTGSDGFVYNDKFGFTKEELAERLGIDSEQAERLVKFTSKSSKSHSAWLTFMAPRLQLARDLLTDDGVIFISIDDNEQANLKLLCDSIFGEENFVANFKWNKTATPPSLAIKVRGKYEYVLCYEKNRTGDSYNAGETLGGDMPLLNDANSIRELVFPKESIDFRISGSFSAGRYDRVELKEDIEIIDGQAKSNVVLSGPFKWTQTTVDEEISNGTTFVIKSNKFAIRYARKGIRYKKPSDIISKPECGVETNDSASSYLEKLMDGKVFSFPKPVSLVQYLVDFTIDSGDIVMDFFSGSATTAEAVMSHNALSEGDSVSYILVQLPEETGEKSEAHKAGYETIDQIGMERIRRAAAKIKADTGADIDYGFKHYTLVDTDKDTIDKMTKWEPKPLTADSGLLDAFGRETVLATWMVRDGYGLGQEPEEVKFGDYTAYYVGRHLYFLDPGYDEYAHKAFIEKYGTDPEFTPENIILYGYSFSMSARDLFTKNKVLLRNSEKNLTLNISIRY